MGLSIVKTYTISIGDDNQVRVYDASGQPIHFDDYVALSDQLKRGHRQRKTESMLEGLDHLIEKGYVIRPQKRSHMFKSGDCVYFIQCDAMPGMVKIGYTLSLTTRTATFRNEYGCEMRVLAFIKTPSHKLLEQALHYKFAEYRYANSEWFDEAPVIEFVNGLVQS